MPGRRAPDRSILLSRLKHLARRLVLPVTAPDALEGFVSAADNDTGGDGPRERPFASARPAAPAHGRFAGGGWA